MTDTALLLEHTFDAAIRLVSSVWSYVTVSVQPGYANYTKIDRWGQCENILPHIMMLKHVFITYNFIESKNIASKKEFLVLLSEVAWYHTERGNSASNSSIATFAFEIIQHSTDDIREIAAALHGTLQHVCFDTNDPTGCLSHSQQALTISQELYVESGKQGKLATALAELGKACNRNGMHERAMKYYAQSRAMREVQEGFDKLALFRCLLGTGNALLMLGRYEEAGSLVEEALEDRARSFGIDDREGVRTGLALYALGNIRLSQGRHSESFSLHQRALGQFEATVGSNHRQFADGCYKVGEHHLFLKQ